MSQIPELKRLTKSGIEVTLFSPSSGLGAEILDVVRFIMTKSKHLLTEPDELTFTAVEEDRWIQACLEHLDHIIIIPKIAGKIVGMMNFSCGNRKRNSHQGEFGMSIHPDFQGLGIGRMMLHELITWATANPRIETLRLRVHAQNSSAISLYLSMRFNIEGRELNGVKLGTDSYDDVIMMAKNVPSPLSLQVPNQSE